MHADIEQLLSTRCIGDLPQALAGHVAQCPACMAEWQQIQQRREKLQSLPVQWPPADSWRRILGAYGTANGGWSKRLTKNNVRFVWWLSPALAAGIVVLAIAFSLHFFSPGVTSTGPLHQFSAPAVTKTSPVGITELMAESRRLESSLRRFNGNSVEVRADTAGTVAALEDQLTHVDQQLMLSSAGTRPGTSVKNLWQTRVELLNSLLDVRYAQEVSQAL